MWKIVVQQWEEQAAAQLEEEVVVTEAGRQADWNRRTKSCKYNKSKKRKENKGGEIDEIIRFAIDFYPIYVCVYLFVYKMVEMTIIVMMIMMMKKQLTREWIRNNKNKKLKKKIQFSVRRAGKKWRERD